MEALSESAVLDRLDTLPEWKYQDHALVRTTTFPSFLTAISFINAVAHLAERQDHHPDLTVQYHRVTVRYWTHRAKGVTDLDFVGAQMVEQLIPEFKRITPARSPEKA